MSDDHHTNNMQTNSMENEETATAEGSSGSTFEGEEATSLSSPLGLTLRKTPSLLDLVEKKLSEARQQKKLDDFTAQPSSQKYKASCIPTSLLIIGSWQRNSTREGDLQGKIYFAKRKLVWEMLELGEFDNVLKTKIEVQWSDISAIRASMPENDVGMLEIELNQPPSFFREINPQPRKHTVWTQASDFTGGQASICRRQTAYFPPGALDEHYEKLLSCDQRFFELSIKPFSSNEHPYFYPNPYGFTDFPSDINGHLPEFSPVQQNYPVQNFPVQQNYPVQNFPAAATILPAAHCDNYFKQNTFPPSGVMIPNSPMSVMDLPYLDEGGSGYMNENQRVNHGVNNQIQGYSDEGGSGYMNENQWVNHGVNNQIQGLDSISMATAIQGNNNIPDYYMNYGQESSSMSNPGNNNIQNYYMNYGQESSSMNNPNNVLYDTGNHLLGDSQATYSDDMAFLTRFSSMHRLLDLQQAQVNTIQDHPQNVRWFPPNQVPNRAINIDSSMNTPLYPYVLPPEPTMEDFAAMAARQNSSHRRN